MASSVFCPPDQTRLVTICAHVDHGKTTLADNLIESNGIISERLAGTLRYLDSLEEEQRRGITMRASAIGLRHSYRAPPKSKNNAQENVNIVVHLLDSPGHTDFSTEVSSSLQCCDGCLVVVDAVEGMCARTHQVVREAHSHQLVPILVINKLDRLCTNLCLTPTEAYLRIRALVESVNATCAAMLVSKQADAAEENQKQKQTQQQKQQQHDDEEEARWTFQPEKGNVIFASALYGWGFTVPSLSRALFRKKALPLKPMILKQCLFGDFKFKDSKVLKWKSGFSDDQPLFAEYALQPIWEIYEAIASASAACGAGSTLFADGRILNNTNTQNSKPEKAKIQATTTGMDQVLALLQTGGTGQKAPPATLEEIQTILTHTGASTEDGVLRSILRRYRPLSDIVLDAVYEVCPSPKEAASSVRPRALAFSTDEASLAKATFRSIQQAAKVCDVSPEAPTVAHVCKFMPTDRAHIRDPALEDADSGLIMGMARVLSGVLKTDNEYFVMGPKHNSSSGQAPKRKIRLYLIMGSSFVLVKEVPAGHLCAIQNLEDVQLKTATLCDSPDGMPLKGFDRGIRPLVKVSVEAVDATNTYVLERGLIKLSLADSAVEVTATAKGERILACLGELHLEQSLLDLKKLYCEKDIDLRISDPIVEFGETSDWFEGELDFETFFDAHEQRPVRQCTIPPYNEEEGLEIANRGRARVVLSGRVAALSLRVVPLKELVFASLKANHVVSGSEESLVQLGKALKIAQETPEAILDVLCKSLRTIDENGNAIVESETLTKGLSVKGVISDSGEAHVPPRKEEQTTYENGENDEHNEEDFVVNTDADEFEEVRSQIRTNGFSPVTKDPEEAKTADETALQVWKKQMQGNVVAGFQTAVRAGPICEEPVRGVLVVLEGVEVAVKQSAGDGFKESKPLTGGMIVAALRTGIRCSLLYVITGCIIYHHGDSFQLLTLRLSLR
jgi:ribosome assembly protein 1